MYRKLCFRMKKIIIISVALTGLLVGALIFYGCKKDTQEGSLMKQDAAMTPTNLNFGDPNTYGILHNEIAEYVLSQDISLIDKNVFANASIEEHYRIIDSCISYCVKAGYLGDDDAILVRKKLYEVFYNFWQHTLIKNSSIDFFKDVLASDGFSDNMIILMFWICIQFYIFPINFMSTLYFLFGILQTINGWLYLRQSR